MWTISRLGVCQCVNSEIFCFCWWTNQRGLSPKGKKCQGWTPKLINTNHTIFLLTGELKLGWTWNSALRIFWYGLANILIVFSFHWNLNKTPTWLRLCSSQPSPSLQLHLSMGTLKIHIGISGCPSKSCIARSKLDVCPPKKGITPFLSVFGAHSCS
jgi:hypothetical protein